MTKVKVHDGSVDVTLVPKRPQNVDLELWAVEKERPYFREVFGIDFSATAAPAA